MEIQDKKLTPLMKQYWEVKSVHMDKILFFRMGDFYELFDQDAVTVAPILGIALTARNKNNPEATAMCGMPHHSAANYINKLLSQNFKVAICDQLEEATAGKGIVKRGVTRILSPGMVYDPETLDQVTNNYICSYDETTVSFLEATTGECFYYKFSNENECEKLIQILQPVELILDSKNYKNYLEAKTLDGPCVTEHNELTGKNVNVSSARLLSYAITMQGEKVLQTLQPFEERNFTQRMELNFQTIKHLEIFETYRGETKGSFFNAINKTKTAAGSRKLKNWILFPLQNLAEILKRQTQIEFWSQKSAELKRIRQILGEMGDIERRLGKISNPTCNARDLASLKNSLQAGVQVSKLSNQHSEVELHNILKVIQLVEKTIVDEPPIATKNGHMIRSGFDSDLDRLIELSEDSQSLLADMEKREKDTYGISSLKIRYNSVFGFYIEVTKTHTDKVPKHYVRKQTLTNAERYTTDELYKLETQVLSAKTKREELEFAIFDSLRNEILKNAQTLLKFSQEWSEIDVVSSLAWLALEMNYTKPTFTKDRSLKLKNSRHPVIEQLTLKPFVPNDIEILPNGCLFLTGPNMAGKSTLMRQVALTAILAQMGSFIPAKESLLPIFDRIFTRIGASDDLSRGLSTFMVEMTETAYLLKNSTEKSLVVLDEIGRGTSTYDGMSLAQSILEYLVSKVKATTLFATHYHEITSLQSKYTQIENMHMKVAEQNANQKNKDILFLYTLTRGPANKSYGIEVAKLAGLPIEVTSLAKKILEQKENSQSADLPLFTQKNSEISETKDSSETDFVTGKWKEIIEEITQFPTTMTSPLEALNKIENWKKTLN
jgi:DNA mismatch repair protein MutS